MTRLKVHFIPVPLFNPVNPISVILIGAGGTGSHMLEILARINFALTATGKAGLHVTVFDNDCLEASNFGRGDFNQNYLGLNKAVAIVSHINRKYGTNWKAIPTSFLPKRMMAIPENRRANITISCVDTVNARLGIAEVLQLISQGSKTENQRDKPYYHIDFGNGKDTGQMILSTVGKISQPQSEKYEAVDYLPSLSEEFADLLDPSKEEINTPSCSVFDALSKQGLFINSALANHGGKLIHEMLDKGIIEHRGFFMNLENFKTEALKI